MYAAVHWIGRTLVRQYYSFSVHGQEVPNKGPLVLVGNHTNGLIDPGALFHATARELRFLAKFRLFRVPVLGSLIHGARAIPVYRKKDNVDTSLNKESFKAVHAALLAGEAVVLFPEGESGPELRLRRFKTGAARMALAAEAEHGFTGGLHIAPIGLFYEDRDRYRSRVHVWIGEAFRIDHLAEAYATDERAAVERLTGEIRSAIERVTVAYAHLSDRPVLELAAAIGPPAGAPPERLRTLARGLEWLREHRPQRAEQLVRRARDLTLRLAAAGLDASDIEGEPRLVPAALRAARGILLLLVGAPLVALGALAWALPVTLARLIARFGPSPPDKYVTVTILGTTALAILWIPLAPLVCSSWLGVEAALVMLAVLVGAVGWMPRLWEHRRAVFADLGVLLFLGPRRRTRRALVAQRDGLARELEVLDRLRRRTSR